MFALKAKQLHMLGMSYKAIGVSLFDTSHIAY